MIVISDTSPLTALLLAGRDSLLPALFDRVVIPLAVQRELLRAHTDLPEWIEVLSPGSIPASVSAGGLDPGKRKPSPSLWNCILTLY